MMNNSCSVEDWQQWIQFMLDRLPAKKRYQKFYSELDRNIPEWCELISDPIFTAWGCIPDTADGVCMLDRLHALWADPVYGARNFAALLRLYIGETPAQPVKADWRPNKCAPQMVSTSSVPVLLNRYELLRKLGCGGNGVVYLAWSRETSALYALKLIRRELATDLSARQAFRREAGAWIRIGDHPHIAKAHFYDEVAGTPMVTMEFVEGNADGGPSLADKIKAGRLNEAQVARWFVQVADGLAHAYTNGIKAHRDIKPGNILITRDGDAQISDFGLAVPIEAVSASDSASIGTPCYMSPEQFAGRDKCDVRSDIYSLGISLYETLSGGTLPFMPEGHDAGPREFLAEMRSLHLQMGPSELNTVFWPVIARCLAKDPDDRFADVAQFRESLVRIATPLGYAMPNLASAEVDVWTLRDQGNTLMRLGQYEKAIQTFDAFLGHFPDEGVLINRACCLEKLGRYAEALPLYRRLADRGEVSGLVNGSNCLRKMGDMTGALEYATHATRLFPADSGSWIALGNVHYSLAAWQDAIDSYMRACQLDPVNPTPPYNSALAGLHIKNANLEKQALQVFLELASPDDDRLSYAQHRLQVLTDMP